MNGKKIDRSKAKGVCLLLAGAACLAVLALALSEPLMNLVKDPQTFRDWVSDKGIWGQLACVGLMFLQVAIAVLPGEPLEIAAGYAFGAWQGMALCLIGALLGCLVVVPLTRRYGTRLMRLFFKQEQIDSLGFLQNTKRLKLLVFVIFFIPGSPKDLLNYGLGLTRMRLTDVLLVTGIARIPSIITSTLGGSALGQQNYLFAAAVFLLTGLISAAGLWYYRKLSREEKAA
ncbi:VTT domain-containing protein [Beduinella massiliensis]|uniref:VTT domain-containing protein n=1 Tax=Beduinella massiliensis TaxID=1852363 RepID=UPI000C8410CC